MCLGAGLSRGSAGGGFSLLQAVLVLYTVWVSAIVRAVLVL